MSRAQMNTNKRRGAAQMHSTPSFTYSAFLHLPQLSGQNLLSYMTDGLFQLPKPLCARHQIPNGRTHTRSFPASSFTVCAIPVPTYQLMISGGDVKAVQGTTGHATADMLVNTYAHIQKSSRVELGKKFEEGFYVKQESPSPQAVPAAGEPTISMTALLELLKNADPEVKAQLRLALLT